MEDLHADFGEGCLGEIVAYTRTTNTFNQHMSLLSSIINESPKPQHSFLIFLSSIAQSSLPLLRQLLSSKAISHNTGSSGCLLFCFSYPATDLLEIFPSHPDFIQVHDCVSRIPEYDVHRSDPREIVFSAIRTGEQH